MSDIGTQSGLVNIEVRGRVRRAFIGLSGKKKNSVFFLPNTASIVEFKLYMQ